MPASLARSTNNRAEQERRTATRLQRERRKAWSKKIQEELEQGMGKGVENTMEQISGKMEDKLKKKLEQKDSIEFTVKKTRTPLASQGRHAPSPIHREAPPARMAAHPRPTERTPWSAEPSDEDLAEEAPMEEDAAQAPIESTETGGLPAGDIGTPQNLGDVAGEESTMPERRESRSTPAQASEESKPETPTSRRRYEPTVTAPAEERATGAPFKKPEAAPTTPNEKKEEEQPQEEKKQREGQKQIPEKGQSGDKESAEERGEPGQKKPERHRPKTHEQDPVEKTYEPFSEPEPGTPASEAGAPAKEGSSAPQREAKKGEEAQPDTRQADQEAQRQQATALARQRQQTRQGQKQKKADEEKQRGKTKPKGANEGFRDLTGLLLLMVVRDIFFLIFGWIDLLLGLGVINGLFLIILALPMIFFIKKQDKKRLMIFISKEIAPKWATYASAFATSNALTMIYLDRKYKLGGLIPGVGAGAITRGVTKN